MDTAALTEPLPVNDVFVEGVAKVTKVAGNCLRFTLFATRDYDDGQAPERVIVAQMIWPIEALREAMARAEAAIEEAIGAQAKPAYVLLC